MTGIGRLKARAGGVTSSATRRIRASGTTSDALTRPASTWAGKWFMPYFAGYSSPNLPTADIPWSLMTHIAIFSAIPRADATLNDAFDQADSASGRAWAKGISDAAKANGVIPVMVLGGGLSYSANFKTAISTSALRTTFASNVVALAEAIGVTQIDWDYEPIAPSDIPNIIASVNAVKSLRPTWKHSIPGGQINNNNPGAQIGTETSQLTVFDMVNFMNYGMGQPYEGWTVWHSSPLYGRATSRPMDIDGDVSAYAANGIANERMGVGMGGYGTAWTGVTAPGQTPGTIVSGDAQATSLPAIRDNYVPIMTRVWDDMARVPYLTSPTGKGSLNATFISYEDAQSVGEKVAYIKRRNIGGMILWHLQELYEPSRAPGDRFPILKIVADAFKSGQVESTTPAAPTFTDHGDSAGTYTIPTTSGVTYKVGGAAKPAGTYNASGSTVVTAVATLGRVITSGATTSWSHTYSTVPVVTTLFSDNFSGTLANWVVDPDVSIVNGQLSVPSDANYRTAVLAAPFAGAQARVAFQVNGVGSGSSHEFNAKVRDSAIPGNTAMFYISSGNLSYRVEKSGTTVGLTTPGAWNSTTMKWLSIRESGGTWYFETSPDGIAWNLYGSSASTWAIGDCNILFMGGMWGADPPGSILIDNVTVTK